MDVGVFFFKQKTAYEMRISDGSSDVCSSDLVGEAIGFDRVVANELLIEGGKLSGKVAEPIVDKDTKLETLKSEAAKHGLPLAETLAVGDGANDIPMLTAAGLGIASHPHQLGRAACRARVCQYV